MAGSAFDEPQRLMAWGFVYFLLAGLLRFQHDYLARRNQEEPREAASGVIGREAA